MRLLTSFYITTSVKFLRIATTRKHFISTWNFMCWFTVFCFKNLFSHWSWTWKIKMSNNEYFKLNINKSIFWFKNIIILSCDLPLTVGSAYISDVSSNCKRKNLYNVQLDNIYSAIKNRGKYLLKANIKTITNTLHAYLHCFQFSVQVICQLKK